MRQVFFSDGTIATPGGAGTDRFGQLTSSKVGFWDLDAATGGAWLNTALHTTGSINPQYFQVAQGFATNNPIASPIISAQNVVRITAAGYQLSQRHTVRITPAGTDTGDNLSLRVVVRNTPTDYISYVNNEVTIADLSGSGYQFPLGQFNTTNHKLMNLAVSPGATIAAICQNANTAILNNNTFNSMFTVTLIGGAGTETNVDITARHAGVIFDVIVVNEEDETETSGVVQQAWDPGVGNDWQVRGDELKAREYAGNFNRMYFPQTYADFVTDNSTWDRFEIIYKTDGDRDVVKGSIYGSLIIYEPNGTAATQISTVLNGAVTPTAGTTDEYYF
jgi:hypothetical protein